MGGGFVIRLVLADNSRREWIRKAAEGVQSAGLPTEKIDADAVVKLTERDNHMYVCDPFEGQAFDHLLNLGCRIVGPQCVLSCLEKDMAVPKVNHPVFSMSMHNVLVSCSSIEKTQRDKLHRLIEWMGGTVSKNFTDTVTHLIAGEVGSKKYHVAASLRTPVMLPNWVFNCWERGLDRYVCATDDNILPEFSCPVFKGCVICVTGLENDERKEIRTLADENGGHYTGEMKFNECTHLIVNSPKGPKYEFARKWKIQCVTSKWFFDSIEMGYCQDENLYPVVSEIQATSTPKDVAVNPRLSARPYMANCSAISNISMPSAVNDTAMTDANISMAEQRTDLKELDELDLLVVDAGLFLDGCKVFLSGFSGVHLEKLRKIINSGGATRFNQINESVSHVVMGERVPEHINMLMQSSLRPHVVSALWLIDSFKKSTQVSEEPYICLNLPPVTSASPASQSRSEQSRRSSVVSSRAKDVLKKSVTNEDEEVDDADVMQQYLPAKTDPDETTNDSEVVFKLPQEADGPPSPRPAHDEEETQMDEEPEEGDITMLAEGVGGIFSGKSFVILGFPPELEEQILEMTVGNGGKVKSVGSRCVADFAVVPINGCEVNVSVQVVVSNCWLQMCIEEATLLDPASNPLFSPIVIMEDASPLCDCVLTVSQFAGVERDCLIHIAELLGATCQEYFSRKATDKLRPNTHLLLREASGSKYKAAKKWKVPAVTKEWLLETARTNKLQPEKKYHIDLLSDQQDPSRPEEHAAVTIPQAAELAAQESDKGKISSASEWEEGLDRHEQADPSKDPSHNIIDNQPVIREAKPDNNVQMECNNETRTCAAETKAHVHRSQEQQSKDKVDASQGDEKENRQGVAARGTPIINKHLAVLGSTATQSKDTPSKFLHEGTVFHPAFDTKDALEYLESPAGVHHKKRHARKSSLPLDDFFHMNVAKAVQKTGEQATDEEAEVSVFQEQVKSQGILGGVVICVSKKLIAKQAEYNAAAVSLGAEFHWTFDDTCTHFIFKGRTNDTSKEFRMARDKGMFIVSPFWLLACEEEERHVDEASYPHTFNPKMSLSVVSTRHETPSRTPARSTRQTRSMARTPHAPPVPPPPQHDETTMDGLEGSTDSDEELMKVAEAAEKGEGETAGGREGSEVNEEKGSLSLEQRENLQKQLEGIMSSTMNVIKGGRRRSRIHKTSTSGASSVNDGASSGRDSAASRGSSRRLRSSRAMARSEESGQGGSGRTLAARPLDLHHEASQNVHITWDDPTGRKEREKIMAQLKRSCSPLQNSAEQDRDVEMTEVSPSKPRAVLEEPGSNAEDNMSHTQDSRDALPSPTPRAPPIRLPLANPPVAPQPVQQKVEEPEQEVQPKPQLKFLLSGMSQEEKIDYSALIEQLGGVVKDGMYFDPSCSHIVVGNPTRNEKYLASLASGKWVLHKSFFEACRKAGEFVEEELHEWGSATDLSTLSEQTVKLALAACRWRRQLQQERQNAGDDFEAHGAFTGWSVVLYLDRTKEASFKRILLSGGAKVVGMRPPFTNLQDVTHAFIDLQKTKAPEGVLDLEAMAAAGILCLKPEYIAEFLMQEPAPDHTKYFISEIKPIMERLYESRHHTRSGRTPSKRKRHDASQTPTTKKGRMR